MKKNFYNNNFESLLKEKLDEFKMLPSKKNWHSIYNDLHPDKRWPSITISLLLITTLSFVGYFNTTPANKQTTINNNNIKTNPTTLIANTDNKTLTHSLSNSIKTSNYANTIILKDKIATQQLLRNNKTKQSNINSTNNYATAAVKTNYPQEQNSNIALNDNEISPFNTDNELFRAPVYRDNKKTDAFSINSEALTQLPDDKKINKEYNNADVKNSDIIKHTINNQLSDNDRAWIDNYALYNKSRKNAWKENISYEIYATPNISYRKLSNRNKYNALDNDVNNNEYKNLNQQPALGIETGVGIIYPFAKNIRLKSSLQFNYTNYSITALETNHPILTTLMMEDLNAKYSYLEPRVSTLSNISVEESSQYHNKTYQISIPVGLEFKIAGTQKLQWYASTNIQPTYTMGGNAYLISSDKKNYVKDGSLIRRWNMNTSVGTYASYQTKNGTKLQFGPQYRYQLISTYKRYDVSENIYHLGIKFEIVKNF
jgi:hypothetical protein